MHYIAGTRFSTIEQKAAPGQRVFTRKDTRLPANMSFCLLHIMKKDSTVEYKFLGSNNQVYSVTFNNCREGDAFIAKYKNEVIPNYEEKAVDTEI